MKKIVLLLTGIFLAAPSYSQFKTANPSTFPFYISDVHIFDDGSAYIVSKGDPYLVKEDDISQIDSSGGREIIHLNKLRLSSIQCVDKATCIARGQSYWGTNDIFYKTIDSGQTWIIQNSLNSKYSLRLITPQFWVAHERNGSIVSTQDGGNSWQNLGYADLRFYHSEGSLAYFYSYTSGDVYTVSTAGVNLYAQPKNLIPGITYTRALFPSDNGHILVADSGKVYAIDSTFTNYNLLHDLSEQGNHIQKFADSIVIISQTQILTSFDNGSNWQLNNLPSDKPYYLSFQYQYIDHYRGKYFYEYRGTGGMLLYDYVNNQMSESPGNRHPTTSTLIDLQNGTYYAPATFLLNDSTLGAYLFDSEGNMLRDDLETSGIGWYNPLDFADSLHGVSGAFAGTHPGYINTTSNGGQSWTKTDFTLKLGANQVDIYDLNYSNDANCVFASVDVDNTGPRLLKMDPNLNIIDNKPTANSLITDFQTCDTGFIYDYSNGQLQYTTDGGTTTTSVVNVGGSQILSYRETSDGFAVLSSSGLYHAPDVTGPFQFIPIHLQPYQSPYLLTDKLEIFHFNPENHVLYYSSDSGKTKTALEFPLGALLAMYQVDSSTIMMAGQGGQIHILKKFDKIGVGTEEQIAANTVAFYPNPARMRMNLEFPDSEERQIEIFNLESRKLLNVSANEPEISIDISSLPAGYYICKVHGDNQQESFKFLKI